MSITAGVGNNENAFPSVGSANIGRSVSSPFRSPPDFGKVSEDRVKAKREVASDVFQDCESGSYCANGVKDIRPEVSFIILTFPITCMTKWLAWITTREDVHRLNVSPVDCGDVAKVGDTGVMHCEDLTRRFFYFGVPSKIATNGHV